MNEATTQTPAYVKKLQDLVASKHQAPISDREFFHLKERRGCECTVMLFGLPKDPNPAELVNLVEAVGPELASVIEAYLESEDGEADRLMSESTPSTIRQIASGEDHIPPHMHKYHMMVIWLLISSIVKIMVTNKWSINAPQERPIDND